MNFGDYITVLRKRWRLVLAVLAICVVAAVGVTLSQTKLYKASTEIFVSTATADSASQLAMGNSFAQARVQSYIDAATSPAVTDAVIKDLGLPITSGQLASHISADAPSGKVLINLHVVDRSPQQAALIANAVAQQFSKVVQQLELTPGSADSPVKLSVLQPAVAPSAVSSPNTYLNVGLGVIAGLILGIGIALARELLDNTFKSPEHLTAASNVPVLGTIPWDRQISTGIIATRIDTHGRRAEAFRHLRTNLDFVDVGTDTRIVAVTSAMAAEGKTSTAVNIATALAEAGERVCLIEADLRRPTIAESLGLVGRVGLTSVLIGKATVEEVVQNAGQNLAVITAGEVPPNPNELVHSQAFRDLLKYVAERVDRVVIDAAPLLPVADGLEVAAAADITLLVVRSGKTTREQVRRAIQSLLNVGVTPVGAILSMATQQGSTGYAYYYGNDGRAQSPDTHASPPDNGVKHRDNFPTAAFADRLNESAPESARAQPLSTRSGP